MPDPTATPDPSLRARLESAAEGLLYTSESDYPFDWFFLPGGAAGWPYRADEFARRAAVANGGPAEEWTLDRFLAPHLEASDPLDERAQALRSRYQALEDTLREALADLRVFRAGRVEVHCYAVGADARGNLAGLHTVAMET